MTLKVTALQGAPHLYISRLRVKGLILAFSQLVHNCMQFTVLISSCFVYYSLCNANQRDGRSRVPFPAGAVYFFLILKRPERLCRKPSLLFTEYSALFPWGLSHLVPSLKASGALHLLCPPVRLYDVLRY
jgi:hypothetical protein